MTAKLKEYLAIAFSLLLTIVTFGLWARGRGVKSQELKTDNAVAQADVDKANTAQLESRHDTDATVDSLPEAPSQVVGAASPATAAGKLGNWTRD